MAEASDEEHDPIRKEMAKGEGKPRQVAPLVREKEKPARQEYMSEDKRAPAKTKIENILKQYLKKRTTRLQSSSQVRIIR